MTDDNPIHGPVDISDGSQGRRYLSVVFQREFGFVEGDLSPSRWQTVRQLPPEAFIARNCPAPRDVFPVHKSNTLAKNGTGSKG
jgi:hypothetical protein